MKGDQQSYRRYNSQYHHLGRTHNYDTVYGFDTETIDGEVFLIACNDHWDYNRDEFGEPMRLVSLLFYLTKTKFSQSYNFFYNMRYDMQSILKLLPEEDIKYFYEFGELYYEASDGREYHFWGVDDKFMYLRRDGGPTCYYYDIAQFFHDSLEGSSQEYLGKTKLDDDIDVDKFDDKDYIQEHRRDIIKYCRKDARLCKELSEYFIELGRSNDMRFDRPFSPAFVSQINFVDNCDIPTLKGIPERAIRYSQRAYNGGLFDVWQKGTFHHVNSFDINSAYPDEMTRLIDIQYGSWDIVDKCYECADYGYYKVNAKLDFPILPYKHREKIHYPIGEFEEFYTSKNEIEFIREHDLGEVEVIDGIEFDACEIHYPFKDYVNYLADFRNELKAEDDDLEAIVKIVMNGQYGKTIQSIVKSVKASEENKYDVDIGERCFEYEDDIIPYTKVNARGKLYNPMYATEITSNTRLTCLEVALQNPEKVVSIQTDSVQFKDGYIPDLDFSPTELGKWDKEYQDETFTMINTGIYQYHGCGKYKLRGIGSEKSKAGKQGEKDLLDRFEEHLNDDKISVSNYKPITLKSAMKSKKHEIEDANKFRNHIKKIDINQADKRKFYDEFEDCEDVLNRRIESRPFYVDELH